MTLLQRFRILPLLVIVALLSFTVRVGEFAYGLRHSGAAFAQEKVDEPVPPLPSKDDAKAADKTEEKAETKTEEAAADKVEQPPADESKKEGAVEYASGAAEDKNWRDASDTDYEHSSVRAELFRDLSKRREEIEKKETALVAREALLLAAERELDAKLRELTSLRGEIEVLLKQQTDEEKARITSLVQIYEGMKAKDAARIFNTLDMDVLLSVMGQMSERKSAPILAEMNAERARAVTVSLSQQNKLPELPAQ